jgi:hypothetical protein
MVPRIDLRTLLSERIMLICVSSWDFNGLHR